MTESRFTERPCKGCRAEGRCMDTRGCPTQPRRYQGKPTRELYPDADLPGYLRTIRDGADDGAALAAYLHGAERRTVAIAGERLDALDAIEWRNRRALEALNRDVASADRDRKHPEWAPAGLERYQRHVLRWAHCRPAGALLLPAPLSGWRGEPYQTRGPVGPRLCYGEPMRRARVRHGLDPIDPRERIVFGPVDDLDEADAAALSLAEGGSTGVVVRHRDTDTTGTSTVEGGWIVVAHFEAHS